VLAAVAGLAALTGCGSADGSRALRDTSRNLSKIHSGDLTMRLVMSPSGKPGVGFSMAGPFALRRDMRLPVARIAFTQLAGSRRVPATLISTGASAFVAVAGTTYRLPAGQADALRIVTPGARGLNGLQLDIGRWIDGPRSSGGPSVGGDETDRISGRLRIGSALHDLFNAARKAGAGPVPSAKDAARLGDSVTDSSVELLTGSKDRLLRRVTVDAQLDVPARLRARLGSGARLRLQFELGVAHPNRRVRVRAPSRSQPLA
jgi:hypothetical protein